MATVGGVDFCRGVLGSNFAWEQFQSVRTLGRQPLSRLAF
jgi:hypothetical protein